MKKIVALLLLGATLLLGEGIHWEKDYRTAVAKAETAGKPIFFVFSSHECKWCRHLEATTFNDPEVIEMLNRDFVNVIAYTDQGDYVPQALWSPGTPALWFLDTRGEAMFQPIPGAVGPKDFLEAADIVLKEFEQAKLRQRYGNQKK